MSMQSTQPRRAGVSHLSRRTRPKARGVLALVAAPWAVGVACADEKIVDLSALSSDAAGAPRPDASLETEASLADARPPDRDASVASGDEGAQDAGATSRALYFGAADDARVEVANTPILNLHTAFTIEAWTYLFTFGGGEIILNQWADAQEDKFVGVDALGHFLKSWFFLNEDASTWADLSTTVVPSLATWHHVAVSAEGGNATLYLDGKSVASTPLASSVANSIGTFSIGASNRGGWHGAVDAFIAQVRVSSVARYPSDFTPSPTLEADSDTLAYWPLDEGSGPIAHDLGPNHLDGALVGPVAWEAAPPR